MRSPRRSADARNTERNSCWLHRRSFTFKADADPGTTRIQLSQQQSCLVSLVTANDVRQAECWGWTLGRLEPPDLVAISPTGSGKTLGFLLPAIAEVLARRGGLGLPAPRPVAVGSMGKTMSPSTIKEAAREAAKVAFMRAKAEGLSEADVKVRGAAAYKKAEAKAIEAAERQAQLAAQGGCPIATPYVLVLAPTRELCEQTGDAVRKVSLELARESIRGMAVVGGVDYGTQRETLLALQPELVIATPGRLISLCGGIPASTKARILSGGAIAETPEPPCCRLEGISMLVLDEVAPHVPPSA